MIKRILTGTAAILALYATAASAQVTIHPNPGTFPIANAVEIGPESTITFFSGVVPAVANPDAARGTRAFYGDTEAQSDSVFERIRNNLENRGLDFGNVIQMTVFLVGDPHLGGAMDFDGFMNSYRRYFGTEEQPNVPARSTVEVAGLVGPLMLVEIEVVTAH
jgi:enamine deaminase RidA (YjgF/YER057c/UK114 family)